MVEFPSESMNRYAADLYRALSHLPQSDWRFEKMEVHHVEAALRLLPGSEGEKMASRLGRFWRYPRAAAAAAKVEPNNSVFHVLDHSHANLTGSLPHERTVLTCHDIIPYLAALGLIPVSVGRATRYTFPKRADAMRRCRFVIAVSESTKRDLIEHFHFDPERIIVVYSGRNPVFAPTPTDGRDPAEVTRGLRKAWGIPEDAKVILHVGTANRYKNTPALLRALQKLRAEPSLGERVWLVRAGARFFEDEEALAQELGVADRLVQIGRVTDDAGLADVYRAADVFGFPSVYEGFGWPPLEAMACGTPVVASNIASLPEVVGDGGMTVGPQDIDALAGAFAQVLTDDALHADLRARALQHAAKFTWERCAENVLGVYHRVWEGASTRG
jgi:glycosyltransferase involved in cell wall biosynthesis